MPSLRGRAARHVGCTAYDEEMLRLLGDEMAFHEGAGRVVPPTGRTVTIRWAGVARLADGQVVSLHGYYDQLAFLAQLGLVPQPA